VSNKYNFDNYSTISTYESDSKYIGEEVHFLNSSKHKIEMYEYDPWTDENGKKILYEDLIDKKGTLNWIKEKLFGDTNISTGFWLYKITLENGMEIYNEQYVSSSNKKTNNLKYFYVLSELEELKDRYINKSIWLNKPKQFYVELPFETMDTEYDFSFRNKKGEEVFVKDIIPYNMSSYGDDPHYYFKIQSIDGKEECFIQVSKPSKYKSSPNESYYFHKNPINPDWSEDVVELIKKGKIKIGMDKQQVRLSWGSPDDINRTINEYGTSEQWVYEKYGHERDYLYFDGWILTTIQD
tara:strand:- start:61 stop:948 length:888 start_codon:yes stop_codon:yes gene_type:complete